MALNRIPGLTDRRIWIPLLALAVLGVALWVLLSSADDAKPARPALMVMSSVPLQWGDASMADIASGKAEASPLFEQLNAANRVRMLDDVQRMDAPGKAPLLLVQPRALAPAELVQLDAWVRKGGSVIIFADPALDWPSDLPLGDQRRPLFTSLLNPLFRHWGLELALPVGEGNADVPVSAGDYRLLMKSPGIWVTPKKGKATAKCKIRKDEHIAACAVGRGSALLVADADLLNERQWTGGVLSSGTMEWLHALIAAARGGKPFPDGLWES